MEQEKIGILYICTGNYAIFWKDFYLSMEKNFIPEAEKHYFVFTDANTLNFVNDNPRVTLIYQKDLGWPFNTLMRFHMFLGIEKELSTMDYLFFCNANLLVLEHISAKSFLPHFPETLVATLSPGFYTKKKSKFPRETNSKSSAYIKPQEAQHYFAGGLNGGTTESFLQAMKTMRNNTESDEKKGIIARWHDESHWNRYLIGRTDVKILPPSYLYPEGWVLPMKTIILIRDKTRYGGHGALRNDKRQQIVTYRQFIKKTLLAILHFLQQLISPFENKMPLISTVNHHVIKNEPFLILVIAYNNSDIIKYQHSYLRANLTENFHYIVIDNSVIPEISTSIAEYCSNNNIPYVKLPPNPFAGNPSKSHGVALNWAYKNIVKKIEPVFFGFIDHDIFPFRPTVITPQIKNGLFGLVQQRAEKWYLWTGFCFFEYQITKKYSLDFMPCKGLDTGGSNYRILYKAHTKEKMIPISQTYIDIDAGKKIDAFNGGTGTIEVIGDWIHLMSISNWNNVNSDKISSLNKIVNLTNALCTTSPNDS